MEWQEIRTQNDADALMEAFGDFHDSCTREAHLWTGHWVNPDLSMSFGHLDTRIRFLIQRQFNSPSAIELLFEGVTRFNLVPAPEDCDSIILSATLLVRDRIIYWSPESGWSADKPNRDEFTWVAARRLLWREVNWMGRDLRYGPKQE
jgi:hypothetical protein